MADMGDGLNTLIVGLLALILSYLETGLASTVWFWTAVIIFLFFVSKGIGLTYVINQWWWRNF